MKKFTFNLSGFFVALAGAFLFSFSVYAQSLPAGFSRVKLTGTGVLQSPADLDFASDGRIFIAEKSGKVKIYKDGAILPTPFILLSCNENLERGLSGICLDPNFSTNHFVYLYYTTKSTPVHNRLIRVTANGDVADLATQITLLDVEDAESEFHHGGGMAFGSDGKLYLGIGEDHHPAYAQDLNMYKGKVLRLNNDGTPAAGNPFSSSEKAKKIWTYGHRNPYSVSVQPGTGKIFVSEVGEFSWEEINDVTTAGKNFGWPNAEGMSDNANYKNPTHTYRNYKENQDTLGEGCAITGGTFLSSTSNYPDNYKGKFFFVDFCLGWIRYIDPNNGTSSTTFATGMGAGLIRIKCGPDGNLYHVGTADQQGLFKIVYTQGNTPTIISQPASQTISAQEPVTFSVTASGSGLSYIWMKNGAPISGATASTYTIAHVAAGDAGKYSVKVTNGSGNVISNEATLTVTAFNSRPVATITSPGDGLLYKAGDIFTYTGAGTDSEDGTLPPSAFTWQIDFHHATHIHPGGGGNGVTSGTLEVPRIGEVSTDVFFRIILIVKDSKGLIGKDSVDIRPKVSNVTLNSDPSGLNVTWDGQPHATPFTVSAVVGMTISAGVISPQVANNMTHSYDHWSDGGAPTHLVTVGETATSYSAKFNSVVGIDDAKEAENVKLNVYPNPNQGDFKVEINLDPTVKEKVSLEVINSIGQILYLKIPETGKSDIIENVQLGNSLPAGIYTVKVKVGDRVKTTRISLMK